jgi:hypothetical protein
MDSFFLVYDYKKENAMPRLFQGKETKIGVVKDIVIPNEHSALCSVSIELLSGGDIEVQTFQPRVARLKITPGTTVSIGLLGLLHPASGSGAEHNQSAAVGTD